MLASIAALLAVLTFQAVRPEKYSYAIVAPRDQSFAAEMKKAGEMGYEVVSARRASDGKSPNPTMSYEIILKRRGSLLPPMFSRGDEGAMNADETSDRMK